MARPIHSSHCFVLVSVLFCGMRKRGSMRAAVLVGAAAVLASGFLFARGERWVDSELDGGWLEGADAGLAGARCNVDRTPHRAMAPKISQYITLTLSCQFF